jgi:hypothetical protein
MQQETDALITKFCVDTVTATGLLQAKDLCGQMLVLLFSSIDSMGLLDAPTTQTSANGSSFKAWVKSFLLPNGQFEFNEVDFWAARCSVLHTFTTESDLSKDGGAREIKYYSGPKETPRALAIVAATKQIGGGKHVLAHIQDIHLAFIDGMQQFAHKLSVNCQKDPVYKQRLRKVIQKHAL